MAKYKPLITVALAFIVAAWSYIYYADYQLAAAESRLKEKKEQKEQKERQMAEKRVIKVKARHILVETAGQARELRARILSGEGFQEIAGEFSLCPSGKKGGELGYFRRGQMVPEFEQAAFSLLKGEVSEPVETEFGWHIIEVTDIVR